ncbi:uncharacterized protein LOC134260743 isoform X2 [Saccostrea cucullata]|uniref:uncharacterized protein LOC134260743 isoform X2 n=1 Tax=Saccostrea cuccullata TaxID=36930 RepID=UPI002ED430A8
MIKLKYQMTFFLTAALCLSYSAAGGPWPVPVITTTTTAPPRNISCHAYSCQFKDCIQKANESALIGTCYTPGNCFARYTSNDTYTKEELGCEGTTSGCLTTAHDNNGGRRQCCTSDKCNTLTGLKPSTAPSLFYSLGVILSCLLLCLGKF